MSLRPRKASKACVRSASLRGPVVTSSLVHGLGFDAPLPGVLEGGDLRGGLLAALLLEKHVVAGVGVEGRDRGRSGLRSRPRCDRAGCSDCRRSRAYFCRPCAGRIPQGQAVRDRDLPWLDSSHFLSAGTVRGMRYWVFKIQDSRIGRERCCTERCPRQSSNRRC